MRTLALFLVVSVLTGCGPTNTSSSSTQSGSKFDENAELQGTWKIADVRLAPDQDTSELELMRGADLTITGDLLKVSHSTSEKSHYLKIARDTSRKPRTFHLTECDEKGQPVPINAMPLDLTGIYQWENGILVIAISVASNAPHPESFVPKVTDAGVHVNVLYLQKKG